MKICLHGIHALPQAVDTLAKMVDALIKTFHGVKNSCPGVKLEDVLETTDVLENRNERVGHNVSVGWGGSEFNHDVTARDDG